jgi:hypothetical protein
MTRSYLTLSVLAKMFGDQANLFSVLIDKTLVAGCSKRSQRRGARRSMSGGVLFLYVDAKSVERNEAYESFSAAC